MWQQIVLVGALASAGVVLLIRPLLPTRPRLDAALDRMSERPLLQQADTPSEHKVHTTTRLGKWFSPRLPGALQPSAKDLEITSTLPAEHVGKKILGGLGGLLALPIAIPIWAAVGLQLPFTVTGLMSLALGVLGFFIPDIQLREKASKARLEAARASVAYLLLSSISRASGAGISETMYSTATAFTTPAYLRLRAVLDRARWTATSPWTALQEEGQRTGVPETTEVGDIMRLAGVADAAVTDTLRARARSLRETLLAREIAAEKRRTSGLGLPIGALAIVFVIGALYPPLSRIMGA